MGKSVRLTRLADDSFTNDFKGDASTGDVSMLNDFLSPDEDFYPDKPVAIGEVWDDSKNCQSIRNWGRTISCCHPAGWIG